MSSTVLKDGYIKHVIAAAELVKAFGGIRAASRVSKIPYTTLKDRYARAVELGLTGELK